MGQAPAAKGVWAVGRGLATLVHTEPVRSPESRVAVSPSAAQKLKGSPCSTPSTRGLCTHVAGSTTHQGRTRSPPGFAQVLP